VLPVRRVATGLLALVLLVVLAVVLWPGADYRVALRAVDSGQLVPGNHVVVSGVPVGEVTAVTLDRDRRARIELRIEDGRWRPLPRGTRATITAGSLAGSRNRTVALVAPPTGAGRGAIPDGGTLADDDVAPLVDVDHVLSSLDAPTRRRITRLVRTADRATTGTGEDTQEALRRGGPAFDATARLLADVAGEEGTMGRLIDAAGGLAATLAAHESDLSGALEGARRTTGAVAAERRGLGRTLDRAPRLMASATRTLREVRPTIDRVGATVRRAAPLVDPAVRLTRGLADTAPSLRRATAGATDLAQDAGPLLRRAAGLLPALSTGMDDARTTLVAIRPLMEQIRPYTPDVLSGFTSAFAGAPGGYYDANGVFARVSVNAGGGLLEAPDGPVDPGFVPRLLGQDGYLTGLTNRCPGGAAPPAQDAQSPWKPAGVDCSLAQTLGAVGVPSGRSRP
jgi:phospholipid/cholesterol/gamma-HCH transport system substrate-binding protein